MLKGSYLRKCNSCGKDFAKSAKECPYCGKKSKFWTSFKLIIGVGLLAIICAFAIPIPKASMNDLQKIIDAPIDQVDAAELAWIFNSRNVNADNPIEIMEAEIIGKIVQWELEIFVLTKSSNYFKIFTKPTSNAPGALLTLYPQDHQQRVYLDNIRPGNSIRIKGKITGTQQRRIMINPAVIISM